MSAISRLYQRLAELYPQPVNIADVMRRVSAGECVILPEGTQLVACQPPCGVVRILLGEGAEPRRCIVVPAGSVVAVDLAAETVADCASVRVPADVSHLHHDNSVATPSDRSDWNGLRGFQDGDVVNKPFDCTGWPWGWWSTSRRNGKSAASAEIVEHFMKKYTGGAPWIPQ